MTEAMGGWRLLVAYGNRLRGNDGVAWHVADDIHATADVPTSRLRVITTHQLTPELATPWPTPGSRYSSTPPATGRPAT